MFIHKLLERARCTIVPRRFTRPSLPLPPPASSFVRLLSFASFSFFSSSLPLSLSFFSPLSPPTYRRANAPTRTHVSGSSTNTGDRCAPCIPVSRRWIEARKRRRNGSYQTNNKWERARHLFPYYCHVIANSVQHLSLAPVPTLRVAARASRDVQLRPMLQRNNTFPFRIFVGPENSPVHLDYKFVIPDNRISERCPQREKLNTGKSPGKRYRMTRVNIGRCLSATLFFSSSRSIPKLRTKRLAVTLDAVFLWNGGPRETGPSSVTKNTSEEQLWMAG